MYTFSPFCCFREKHGSGNKNETPFLAGMCSTMVPVLTLLQGDVNPEPEHMQEAGAEYEGAAAPYGFILCCRDGESSCVGSDRQSWRKHYCRYRTRTFSLQYESGRVFSAGLFF
eukprot:scpid86816/ scgid35037/ 